MKSNIKRYRELSTGLFFAVEQWMALIIGIACLSVSSWAAMDGHEAFSIRHLSHLSTTTLVSVGWFLTILVGISGITLMRFAFYSPGEMEPDRESLDGSMHLASGVSSDNSHRLISIAAGRRRR